MEKWINGSEGVSSAIINLAEDLGKILPPVFFITSLLGLLIFLSAFIKMRRMAEANGQGTKSGIMFMLVFGALLGQISIIAKNFTESIFGSVTPATPYGYIAEAQAMEASNPFGGMLLAVFAIVNCMGWFYFIRGLYLFSSIDGKQDREAHLWKSINTTVGSLLFINLATFIGSLAASTGTSLQIIDGF